MGMRSSDLERTLHRLALVERRLERLEAMLRERPPASGSTHSDTHAGDTVFRGTEHALEFPEIRLHLTEPPPTSPARQAAPTICDARAAVEAYPHLLQPLTTLWGHPEFDRYVSRLLVDDRGGRKGFAAEVVAELLFLAQLNHEFCPNWGPRDPWADSQFIGDRL